MDSAAIATIIAAVITVIATGIITTVTIRANFSLNRRQQMAVTANTALGYFTGGTQNRVVGIAALKMVQANSKNLAEEEWRLLYRETTITILCGQLLYLYTYGSNRFEIHELANIITMTDWLLSDQLILFMSLEQRGSLLEAMMKFKSEAEGPGDSVQINYILTKLPEWASRLSA